MDGWMGGGSSLCQHGWQNCLACVAPPLHRLLVGFTLAGAKPLYMTRKASPRTQTTMDTPPHCGVGRAGFMIPTALPCGNPPSPTAPASRLRARAALSLRRMGM